MKRSGAIGNKVAVTRRHIGEYDANRRLDIRDIRKITKDLILVNNEVSTKFGGVAQLGEHLPCKQGVRSSILLISTNSNNFTHISYFFSVLRTDVRDDVEEKANCTQTCLNLKSI